MEDERSNSFWLYKILETIGVSEKIRRKYQKAGINLEILHTIGRRGEITCYNFGSSCEGTTTPGMESDLDLVLCKESCPVIEYLQPEYKEGWVSLMVTDPETAVGYAKLQLVKDGFPLTSNDWEKVPSNQQNLVQSDIRGRLVWKNSQKIPPDESPVLTCRNGPAETVETTIIISTDNVPAYRCRSWPSLANEWIGRVRHYKWPGKTVIGRFKNFGCFLVGVGHPNSKERELEWRISFSLQERELMFELNDVQYKCYVILKMIKRDLIKAAIGDSLSSYHCKTCLFYMIERNPVDIWRPENLIRCVIQCLQLLFEWAKDNYCPNYFIPGENMFDRWMHVSIRENVCQILKELLSEDSVFFDRIKTDNVGAFLQNRKSNSILRSLEEEAKTKLEEIMFRVQIASVDETLLVVMHILHEALTDRSRQSIKRLSSVDIHFVITHLRELIDWISSLFSATEHTTEDTREAIDLLLPFLHTHLASHLAAFAMVCNDAKVQEEYMRDSRIHFQNGMSSDLASGRLKYLTYLYFDGQYSDCEEQLKSLEKDFKPCVLSISRGRDIRKKNSYLPRILTNSDLNTKDLILQYASSSVVFLPTETILIPKALQFEMFRSFGTPDNSRNAYTDYWYDWAVVDGKVYLYFLWYILAVKVNKPKAARAAILKQLTLSAVDFVFHRETAFNLVAWVSMKEGFMLQAFKFLFASWKEVEKLDVYYHQGLQKVYETHHNAAKCICCCCL